MKIIGIIDKHSGPAYHRVLLPYYYIDGIDALFTNVIKEEKLKDIDALIISRFSIYNTLEDILKWREQYGFKLIVDVDDYWQLDQHHIAFDSWKANNISTVFQLYIRSADLVTTTHERLLNEIKPLNNNVHILPNAIPDKDQFQIEKSLSEKVRLFWSGSITHEQDINILKNPLKKLYSSEIRDKVKMVFSGYMKDHDAWDRMASGFTNTGRFESIVIEGTVPANYYWPYHNCDIGLIPLIDSRFNSFKSNLKVLECAHMGAPVIVSMVHPYLNISNVNYVESQTDWFKYIKYLVNNESYREDQGAALKEWCGTYFNFDEINKKRLQLLEHVTGKQNIFRTA
jgi:hypothetical protein